MSLQVACGHLQGPYASRGLRALASLSLERSDCIIVELRSVVVLSLEQR